MAITAETWTSVNEMTFSNLTAHFINNDWELIHMPIGCFGHWGAPSEDEFDDFRRAVEKCGLKSEAIPAVIVNEGSKMTACRGSAVEWELIGCIHQVVKNITSVVFDDEYVKSSMQAARQMAAYITETNQIEEELDRAQVALDPTCVPLKVIYEDYFITWWSAYAMFERLMVLKPAIEALVADMILPEYLNEYDWAIIRDVTTIIRPFKTLQLLLEGQNYVSLSFVPILVSKMRKGLMQSFSDETVTSNHKELIGKMIDDLKETFGSGEDGTVFQEHKSPGPTNLRKGIPRKAFIAMALDPRTKTLPTLSADDKALVWNALHDDLCLEITSSRNDGDSSSIKTGDTVHLNLSSDKGILEDLFDRNYDDEGSSGDIPVHVIAQNELTLYKHFKSLPMLDNEGLLSDPLVWWKMNDRALPFLAKLARKTLNVPAAAVPSKNVFSTAGINSYLRRSMLHSDITEATVFLHGCWNTSELQPKGDGDGERMKRARIN